MKKSLIILSFAFIFLLSVGFVSASWFSKLFTGDVIQKAGDVPCSDSTECPTGSSCINGECAYKQQFYYCAGSCAPIAAGIGSGQCATQQYDCDVANGYSGSNHCKRCRTGINIEDKTGVSVGTEVTLGDLLFTITKVSGAKKGAFQMTSDDGKTTYTCTQTGGRSGLGLFNRGDTGAQARSSVGYTDIRRSSGTLPTN